VIIAKYHLEMALQFACAYNGQPARYRGRRLAVHDSGKGGWARLHEDDRTLPCQKIAASLSSQDGGRKAIKADGRNYWPLISINAINCRLWSSRCVPLARDHRRRRDLEEGAIDRGIVFEAALTPTASSIF
jgi:hypothetical protein